jgi:putative intracellular protease/amidase
MAIDKKKALMVITSHSELGSTGRKTGFYYEELATPYWKLVDAGYNVEIASIKGGKAPADPGSLSSPEEQPASVKRFLGDIASLNKVDSSLSVSAVNPDDYSVVFLPGGHGTMWDFSQSKALANLISRSYENGAVIGSVCHGAAGLLNAKTADGYPLVENKRINSFTANEEIAVGLDQVVPFILETEFKKLGAKYECAENFKPFVVTDGRLVTGQNPASSALVADAVVSATQVA